jgi:Tol biopolymer transport system component
LGALCVNLSPNSQITDGVDRCHPTDRLGAVQYRRTMPVAAGTRLGPYEILAPLGAGGMGEVYKARDTRLDRIVALKLLPAAHSGDHERRLRFEREARAISSLSHPHICALYDIGDQDGVQFLVMEHLEGETLEDRLRRGPLPVDMALRHAVEIAAALDQAHRNDIIHRDLKPANVMLTRNGVKLLDFGLAKVLEPLAAAAATSLPTASQTLTAQGTIMGTFQYMAPEQLEGSEADARSDIFAFGAVMYEMLTGRRAFQGKSKAGLISAIMSTEPVPLLTLQPMAPPALEHVVRTCLDKDPQERWQTAHDVMVQLKWIAEGGSQVGAPKPLVARRKHRERIGWVASAMLLTALAALGWIHFTQPRTIARPTRFVIPQPENTTFAQGSPPFLSPDGRTVGFVGVDVRGQQAIWLRRMGSLEAHPLPGTEGAGVTGFWSPDSRYLGFFAGGKLFKIDVFGGPPVVLASTLPGLGGAWSRNGLILFGSNSALPVLRSVLAAGGEVKPVLSPDKTRQESSLIFPSFLPDGRHFLYYSGNNDTAKSGIRIGSIDSSQTLPLVSGTGPAFYVPEGYVLFTRQNTAFALPFDAGKLRATGEAVPVTDGVGPLSSLGSALSVSQAGVLAYRNSSCCDLQLVWYDHSGTRLVSVGEPGPYRQAALSPDGNRAVLERLDPVTNTWDLWLLDLSSRIMSRLTFDPADDTDPVWSPDGREIAFASSRQGKLDIYRKVIGASKDELVYADGERKVPEWWLKDGTILYTTAGGKDYHQIAAEGERTPKDIFHADFSTDEPCVSPDSRWIAFNSLESGRWEVYIAAFPGFVDKRQISNTGGVQARWRADGKELYYLSLDGKMMAVDIAKTSGLETSVPRQLFETHVRVNAFFGPVWSYCRWREISDDRDRNKRCSHAHHRPPRLARGPSAPPVRLQ